MEDKVRAIVGAALEGALPLFVIFVIYMALQVIFPSGEVAGSQVMTISKDMAKNDTATIKQINEFRDASHNFIKPVFGFLRLAGLVAGIVTAINIVYATIKGRTLGQEVGGFF